MTTALPLFLILSPSIFHLQGGWSVVLVSLYITLLMQTKPYINETLITLIKMLSVVSRRAKILEFLR